jgi:hypothetical protein
VLPKGWKNQYPSVPKGEEDKGGKALGLNKMGLETGLCVSYIKKTH